MKRSGRVFVHMAAALLLLAAPSWSAAQVGRSQGMVEPNLATREDLLRVPNFDAALADQVIAGRPYLDMLALDRVLAARLSAEQRAQVYARLWTPIDLNAATDPEILLIPNLGQRMLREFKEYRPYVAMPQFRREIGKYVNEQELARLEQYVFVPVNLNTASDEDILSIPGVGKRMLHEFKEYRPYKNIEQFRREIGKYVDDKEVARLERYVTIGTP
jgi:DNA uptake protein ComE-like DNA-binding protein